MRIKAFVLVVFVVAMSAATVFAQPAQQTDAQKALAKYITDNYSKREVMIPMRDGVKLFTAIYEPKSKKEKYPIMMSRTPYSVAPYGADKFKTSLGPDDLFVREGYIFVYQDVRGRMMSEGTFVDVRPETAQSNPGTTDESTDAYDTIDWLVKNVANNNGRVGTYGISYPGFYTSAGSINSHPALKACSPQAPVSDWFRGDDMHHNGAVFLAQNYWFYTFFQPMNGPSNDGSNIKPWKGRDTQDGYDYFLKTGGLKEVADSYEKGLGVRQPYWDDMMAHPNYDEYWKDRSVISHLNGVKCATMTVGGLFDNEDAWGAQKTYMSIEKRNPGIFNILVLGPWFHGGWERSDGEWLGTAYFGSKTSEYYQSKMELPFFNHFLKDKGDISNLKEINAYDTGSHEWRELDKWDPKEGITNMRFFLQPGGTLALDKTPVIAERGPAGTKPIVNTPPGIPLKTGSEEYVSDPMHPVPYTQKITKNYPRDFMTEDQRFASTRPDVLTYETEPLTEDMIVAGDIHPELWISSTGTDSDFIVKVIDVFPDDYKYPNGVKPPDTSAFSVFQPGGYEMLLRGEPFPARFRNSLEKPEPLVPGQPAKIRWEMPGITHTFKKGHRIMVQIQSTWFPLVARNAQKYLENPNAGTQADFQKATETVYFGGNTASSITLSILKK